MSDDKPSTISDRHAVEKERDALKVRNGQYAEHIGELDAKVAWEVSCKKALMASQERLAADLAQCNRRIAELEAAHRRLDVAARKAMKWWRWENEDEREAFSELRAVLDAPAKPAPATSPTDVPCRHCGALTGLHGHLSVDGWECHPCWDKRLAAPSSPGPRGECADCNRIVSVVGHAADCPVAPPSPAAREATKVVTKYERQWNDTVPPKDGDE